MVLASILLCAVLPWQTPPVAPAASTSASTTASTRTLERVVVMGASLAAGFGVERSLAEVLDASLRASERPPLGLGDMLFFTAPAAIGERQVGAALDAEPTLVVAIDFLFWFGYGAQDAQGAPIRAEAQRLELLERGLALLTEIECPLVVGDFPDMSASVGKMIAPEQMPAATTLPLLSRRVREWAAARERTYVLPLAEIVSKLGSGKEIVIGRHTIPAGTRLLQQDDLHPNLAGMVLTAQLVGDLLLEHGLVSAEAFETERAVVLGKLKKTGVLRPAGAR